MLDNILNTMRQGVEQVQRRGEELTQVARLKVEIFQLGREMDSHFARLGRAYHNGADVDLLQGIQEDIRRVEEDIRSRERLVTELGDETLSSDATPSEGGAIVRSETTPVQLNKAGASNAPTDPVISAPLDNRPAFVDEPLSSDSQSKEPSQP